MTSTKPHARRAWAVIAAGLIALAAGTARAQDAPDEPADAGDAAEEAGDEAAGADAGETDGEDAEGGEEAGSSDSGSGPAFGDSAQPPGTFVEPEPEPEPEPTPPTEAEGDGEGEGGEPEPEPPPPVADDDGEVTDIELDAVIPTAVKKKKKFWQIQALYELHFNVISDDYSANDWLSFYLLRGNFDLTKFDQLSLRMDLEQRFVADPEEAGLYFGDIRLYYNRKFSIPIPKFPIPGKASVYLTAPTSRSSQNKSIITSPTAVLTLVPNWGPLSLVVNGYFRWNAVKYAESDHRGTPNTMFVWGYMLQLVYAPVDWFAPSAAWVYTWDVPYRTREQTAQKIQSNYYWEIALNFSLPMPEKAPSIDVSLAWAQGANVLEDGVYRLYFAKRDQSELYLAINLIY